jgi:hypothetical protein
MISLAGCNLGVGNWHCQAKSEVERRRVGVTTLRTMRTQKGRLHGAHEPDQLHNPMRRPETCPRISIFDPSPGQIERALQLRQFQRRKCTYRRV